MVDCFDNRKLLITSKNMLDILQLNDMLVPELRELAEELGVNGYKRLNKQDLIYKILDQQAIAGNKKIQDSPAPKQEIKEKPDSIPMEESPQDFQNSVRISETKIEISLGN